MDTGHTAGPAAIEYMTPKQVSTLLKVPVSTLAVWRSTGRVRLNYFKVGHAVRYSRADVEALLAAGARTI